MRSFILKMGHGRLLESNYVLWKLIMGASIFLPQAKFHASPLGGLRWYMPDPLIAAPFLMIGVVQLIGLIMNLRGYEQSWILRMGGGSAAIGMWTWLIWQSVDTGIIAGSLFATSLTGLVASSLFCYMAYHRLPVPGSPGNL